MTAEEGVMSTRVSLLIDCARVRNKQGKEVRMHHAWVSRDDDLLDGLPGGVLLSVIAGTPHPKCSRCGETLPPGRVVRDTESG